MIRWSSVIRELKNIVREEDVLFSREAMKAYSYDGTTNWSHEPDVVVFPRDAGEVSAVMKMANAESIPVTPRGGGTNLSGGSVPVQGGIVLCTTRMSRILKLEKESLTATVETGLGLRELQVTLSREGLFFPPDPQSFLGATIGGMIGENAGGPACLKYGVTKQYVLGLEVVLPTGECVKLGGGACGGGSGYDLMHLFISSEGTLGVVVNAELKLRKLPESSKTVLAVYDDAVAAGESVFRVLEEGVIPGKIEYIDNWIINRIEEMMPLGLPREADAILLFEIDGQTETVKEETSRVVKVVKEHGARDVSVAADQAEADNYWAARKAGFAAVYGHARTVFLEDVTVPRNRMPDLIRKCKELSKKYRVDIVTFGHAGDGNLHPAILTDIADREHYERALKAAEGIFEAAVALGGVLSGEHGIGLEKQRFFNQFTDPVVVGMMKGIKRLVDPNNIMNPGKIWG